MTFFISDCVSYLESRIIYYLIRFLTLFNIGPTVGRDDMGFRADMKGWYKKYHMINIFTIFLLSVWIDGSYMNLTKETLASIMCIGVRWIWTSFVQYLLLAKRTLISACCMWWCSYMYARYMCSAKVNYVNIIHPIYSIH